MVKDKELKMQLLEKLMEDMDGRVLEKDIKPKSKMVIKAEGDNPEEMKEGVIEKLQGLELPDEEQLAEMSEGMEPEMEDMEEEGEEMMEEEMPEMDMSEEEEYMSDMPLRMKEKLMKEKMKQKAKQM